MGYKRSIVSLRNGRFSNVAFHINGTLAVGWIAYNRYFVAPRLSGLQVDYVTRKTYVCSRTRRVATVQGPIKDPTLARE
jgi:hypothetical protein